MARRPTASKRHQRELASGMAADFEAAPLHNLVYDDLGEDDHLAQLLDATAEAKDAHEERARAFGTDGDRVEDLAQAWGVLSDVAETRAREVVAESCATIIRDGDQWVADGVCEPEDVDDAQQEAREWLAENTAVAGRLDLLDLADREVED